MTGLPEPRTPAEQMFRLATGYQVSQIVGACAQLDLARAFGSSAHTAADVAGSVGADPAALERLVRAAATVGLFEPDGDAWRLTELGMVLQDARVRDFVIAMSAPGHWLPWGRMADAVRRGGPVAEDVLGKPVWDYYDDEPEERDHFAGAMSSSSSLVADAMTFDASPYRTIVDVGGSHGLILEALLRTAPEARGVIYDLPGVLEGARGSLGARGLADRVELVGGDFFESVPSGGDLYVLKHILHDWDDERCAVILRNVRTACEVGATLLVLEMLLPEPFEPSRAFILDLTMLALLGGRERTRAEYEGLLEGAGFKVERIEPVAHVSMLVARAT